MSSINPNNIDGTYPIAGQDNDSQGFRDNFTNIKNNLTFAKTEIEDVQAKGIFKTALNGTTLSNELNDTIISGAQLVKTRETINEIGTNISGSVIIDWADAHFQTIDSTNGSISLTFTGWPTGGRHARLRLRINISSVAHTLTLPATVSINKTNIQGESGSVITFPATGNYLFEFGTSDGGASIYIRDLLRNYDNITPTSSFSTANITSNVQSTSTTTGALKVAGGVGILGNLYVAGSIIQTGINYVDYDVTVADNGSGTQTVFHLDGTPLKTNTGVTYSSLKFLSGYTYKFDLSDSSNSLIPLKFSTTPDSAVPASITAYTTGVTRSNIMAGNAGAYVQITITSDTPSPLFLYADDTDAVIDTSGIGGELAIPVGLSDFSVSGNVNIVATTSSVSTTTGALIVAGGVGVKGNINAGNVNATIGTFTNVSATTNVRVTSATGKLGYNVGNTASQGSGSGKNTSVTLNAVTGTITMDNGVCFGNGRTANTFTLTNSVIESNDLILIQHQSVGSLGAYNFAATPSNGSVTINVRNCGNIDLSEAIVLRMAVIKSSNS